MARQGTYRKNADKAGKRACHRQRRTGKASGMEAKPYSLLPQDSRR